MADKTAYPLSGVVPIINTPWTNDDQIDFPSLERLIDRSIEDGISGCIMPAVASEVSKLSDDERKAFVEEVIRMLDGRVHVTAGVSDPDVRRSQRLAEHAVGAGVDGVLCAVPMDIIEDKRAAKTFSHESAQVELPMLMIQDLHWNGYGMNLDTITELWEEIDSFRCLKLETVPAGYKMTQIIEALDRGTKFMTTTAVKMPSISSTRLSHTSPGPTNTPTYPSTSTSTTATGVVCLARPAPETRSCRSTDTTSASPTRLSKT